MIESCAILQYLGEKYPTSLFPQGETRWEVLPWVYWQAANVGPIFGNKLAYTRYITDVPDEARAHPLERFGKEARRLSGVLDRKLDSSSLSSTLVQAHDSRELLTAEGPGDHAREQ